MDVSCNHVFIFGDFNLPGVDWQSGTCPSGSAVTTLKTKYLLDFMSFCGLRQLNQNTNAAQNVLDLVISNNSFVDIELACPLVRIDQYHPPLAVTSYVPRRLSVQHLPPTFRYNHGDYLALYRHFQGCDWSAVTKYTCVEAALSSFVNVVMDGMRRHIPLCVPTRAKYPSWFSSELRNCLSKKRRYHRKFKCTRLQYWYEKFRVSRALAKKLYDYDHKMYVKSVEAGLRSHSGTFWRYCKTLTKASHSNFVLRDGGHYHSDPSDVANIFSDHFSTMQSRDFLGYNASSVNVDYNTDVLYVRGLTTDEIVLAISRLKPKLTTGYDGIPSFVLKGCCDIFVPVLKHLFELSLGACVFPSLWKYAIVVPVFKAGDVSDRNNYRPISLLSNVSKIFESVIYARVYNFIKQKIGNAQHGFVNGRSVESNLCTFISYCAPIVTSQGQVDVVLFDMSKAFDRVQHALLLKKMSAFGLSSQLVDWFSSYLAGRTNAVRVSGVLSTPYQSVSGVPQGSNLGPLLFIMFVNDMLTNVRHSECLQYADDVKVYRKIEGISDSLKLQLDIDYIKEWCVNNGLQLNAGKTKMITLTRKKDVLRHTYTVASVCIERMRVIRDLGVLWDSALRMEDHVNNIVASAFRSLGMVSRIGRAFRNKRSFLTLYRSLVRSKLEFACVAWNFLNCELSARIEAVQRCFVRILFDRFYDRRSFYDYRWVLKKLGLSTLCSRRDEQDILFLFKILNGHIDCPNLLALVQFYAPCRVLRATNLFYVGHVNRLSPVLRAQSLFNCIASQDIDIFMNRSTFRRALINALPQE